MDGRKESKGCAGRSFPFRSSSSYHRKNRLYRSSSSRMDLLGRLSAAIGVVAVIAASSSPSSSSSSSISESIFGESEKIVEEITCQSKYFQPRCSQKEEGEEEREEEREEEVLVIERARYGRMEMSRCVKENFGFIGCSNDVLEVLEGQCSGRSACSLRVLDENFHRRRPCHEDLKSYLEVRYRCVRVFHWNKHCTLQHPVGLNATRGFLFSPFPPSPVCGSAPPSWLLLAKKGQSFKIFLLDFSPPQEIETGNSDGSNEAAVVRCRSYGRIIGVEEDDQKGERVVATPLCTGGGARMKSLDVSKSHALEVQILPLSAMFRVNDPSFLIAFRVVGCPDVTPPAGGWNQRNSDVLLVGCSHTPETWFMHCSDLEWRGQEGNCTASRESLHGRQRGRPSYFFPGAALISFMTFCIGIIIVLTAASILKRKWRWWSETLTSTPGKKNVYDRKFQGSSTQAINKHSCVSYGISGNSEVLQQTKTCGNNNNNNIDDDDDDDDDVSRQNNNNNRNDTNNLPQPSHSHPQYHHPHPHHHHHPHHPAHNHHRLLLPPPPHFNPVRSRTCCSCDAGLLQLFNPQEKQNTDHVLVQLVQSSDSKSTVNLSTLKNDVKQIYLL